MKEITYGWRWNKKSGINPLLVQGIINIGKSNGNISRIIIPYWVLDYEFSGTGGYRVKAKTKQWLNRESYMVHLYPPNTIFWEDKRYGDKWLHSGWILFSDRRKDLYKLIQPYGYVRLLDKEEKIGSLISKIADIGKQQEESGFWNAQSLLCKIIGIILNARIVYKNMYDISFEDKKSPGAIFTESVDTFLSSNISEKITLSAIAEHLHISISSLEHRYKQITGYSPMIKLTKLRIENTKALLLKGYPLKAIAAQLGFVDAFHLSKTFKRLEGLSPREFIKSKK
jgi:AraC-like DNA-binding protein